MEQIYLVENNRNHKKYVGFDSKFDSNYYGSGTAIKLAIEKYGKNNFTKTIIEEVAKGDSNNREEYWQRYYDCLSPNGYNLFYGRWGGDTYTANQNKKRYHDRMSKSQKKLWDNGEYRKKFCKIMKNSVKFKEAMKERRGVSLLAKCKTWTFISPSSEIFVWKGHYKLFCKEHKLSYKTIYRYANKEKVPKPCKQAISLLKNKSIDLFNLRQNATGWTVVKF